MGEKYAALLPVTSKKSKQSRRSPMLLSVEEVLKWALQAAGYVVVSMAVTASIFLANFPISCSQMSKIFQCSNLTPAQAASVDFFGKGFLWFTVPQAVAATVGLLLPRRRARSRWCLALATLASVIAAHYMVARVALIFIVANPGDIVYTILAGGGSVVFLANDLFHFLSLLVGEAE
ncbi:hypothetical protein QOZ80_6AG0508940 [Eleusine coracana subsp. coracana]|nr:hypothetical protein QOZ80_6AG0508940 [Eleusine coracana subsp. coracana]